MLTPDEVTAKDLRDLMRRFGLPRAVLQSFQKADIGGKQFCALSESDLDDHAASEASLKAKIQRLQAQLAADVPRFVKDAIPPHMKKAGRALELFYVENAVTEKIGKGQSIVDNFADNPALLLEQLEKKYPDGGFEFLKVLVEETAALQKKTADTGAKLNGLLKKRGHPAAGNATTVLKNFSDAPDLCFDFFKAQPPHGPLDKPIVDKDLAMLKGWAELMDPGAAKPAAGPPPPPPPPPKDDEAERKRRNDEVQAAERRREAEGNRQAAFSRGHDEIFAQEAQQRSAVGADAEAAAQRLRSELVSGVAALAGRERAEQEMLAREQAQRDAGARWEESLAAARAQREQKDALRERLRDEERQKRAVAAVQRAQWEAPLAEARARVGEMERMLAQYDGKEHDQMHFIRELYEERTLLENRLHRMHGGLKRDAATQMASDVPYETSSGMQQALRYQHETIVNLQRKLQRANRDIEASQRQVEVARHAAETTHMQSTEAKRRLDSIRRRAAEVSSVQDGHANRRSRKGSGSRKSKKRRPSPAAAFSRPQHIDLGGVAQHVPGQPDFGYGGRKSRVASRDRQPHHQQPQVFFAAGYGQPSLVPATVTLAQSTHPISPLPLDPVYAYQSYREAPPFRHDSPPALVYTPNVEL
ncbi:hypothetical protein DIPPA_31169 [Diplonema papillatum]|nr:hypothetical protein DIPPA_31169 [Diplonema papillatum]